MSRRKLIAKNPPNPGRGKRKMTWEMIEFFKRKETITSWIGLSLEQRAVMLHRQFPEVRLSG